MLAPHSLLDVNVIRRPHCGMTVARTHARADFDVGATAGNLKLEP